jgi:uncharacterized protein YwqG
MRCRREDVFAEALPNREQQWSEWVTIPYSLVMGLLVLGVAIAFAHWHRRRLMSRRPGITAREVQAVFDAMAARRLPRVRLIPEPVRTPGALESRIGGAPWQPSGTDWPRGPGGQRLLFLAQVNFADFPPLPDYPESGLLQIFVPREGRDIAWIEPTDTAHVLRWYPEPQDGHLAEIPPKMLSSDCLPFASEAARRTGLALRGEADALPPPPYSSHLADMIPDEAQRMPENDEVAGMLARKQSMERTLEDEYGTHWIGGHPRFVQVDIREKPDYADLDRVVLHIGSDEQVRIGDSGEINVLIRADDLRTRRFERAVYMWDCS